MSSYYFLDTIQVKHPIQNSPATVNKQPIISTNKDQQLPSIKQTEKDGQVNQDHEKQINPDKQEQKNKLAATLKQLDQYALIRKQANSEGESQQQEDEIEKEKIRKVTVPYQMRLCCHF